MTRVVKIAKPGFDVATCTDDELVFSSELDTLKVAHSDSPTTLGEYTHGIGYPPAFFVSAKITVGFSYKWGFMGQEQSNAFEYTFASDGTKFYYAGECKYFLIYQDAS